MSRQHINYTVVGSTKDSGEQDATAIKPVADAEPANAATFKRPSENLRTRTEIVRTAVDDLKFLSDADRAFVLTSTGNITWAGLPTGTFTASANMVLKPFMAPNASSASRLLIGATTASQITIRTRQDGNPGQPRAYNGANTISFDFTPVDTGTGVVVITVNGTPANNFHVQYDSNVISGTTVQQMMDYLNNVTPTGGGAAFVAAGLEAVVDGTGFPVEAGFPVPPAPVVGNKVIISGPEQALRFMAGAADAERHIITPAHLTTFFSDPLNQLIEGDIMCLRYDDLVMVGDGGRRQSLDEFPEDKADLAGLNLFLMRRFPERLPNALPVATVINGALIFINNRSYISGEVGPLVAAGASYQGSPTPPNSWADGTAVSGPISFETAFDTIIQTLGTKAGGTPGAIKVGFTPSGNIAANTVKGALEELDAEKAGLALANTFVRGNTFSPTSGNESGVTATGNGSGSGVVGTGGVTNGIGVLGTGLGSGVGGSFTGGNSPSTGGVLGTGASHATGGPGVVGRGTGTGATGAGGDFLNSATASAGTPAVLAVAQNAAGGPGVKATGAVTEAGLHGVGGGTSGAGVYGKGGAPNGTGVIGEATGTGFGVDCQGKMRVTGLINSPPSIVTLASMPGGMLNSWGSFGFGFEDASIWIDAFGVKHLSGNLTGGASGSSVVVLSAAYRPTQIRIFPLTNANAVPSTYAAINIQPDGTLVVEYTAGGTTIIWLSGTFL